MVAKACGPPIFQKAKREAVAAVLLFEITVVQQHVEDFCYAATSVFNHTRVEFAEANACGRGEHILRGRFRKHLHGEGATPVVERVEESRLVVCEIALAGGAKHPRAVHHLDVGNGVFGRGSSMMACSRSRAKNDCT